MESSPFFPDTLNSQYFKQGKKSHSSPGQYNNLSGNGQGYFYPFEVTVEEPDMFDMWNQMKQNDEGHYVHHVSVSFVWPPLELEMDNTI